MRKGVTKGARKKDTFFQDKQTTLQNKFKQSSKNRWQKNAKGGRGVSHEADGGDNINSDLAEDAVEFFTGLTGRNQRKEGEDVVHRGQGMATGGSGEHESQQGGNSSAEVDALPGTFLPSSTHLHEGNRQTQDVVSWIQLGLCKAVLKSINSNSQLETSAANYYFSPTPVQAKAIPAMLEGKDLCVRAVTGSGKTAAYLLPLLHHLLVNRPVANRRRYIRSVILVPTRELGAQCEAMIKRFLPPPPPPSSKSSNPDSAALTTEDSRLQIALAIGGVAVHTQEAALDAGPDILIATPGRLVDFICNYKQHRLVNKNKLVDDINYRKKQKKSTSGHGGAALNDNHMYGNKKGLDLSKVEILVMDECDKLLTVVMYDQVKNIVETVQTQKELLHGDGSYYNNTNTVGHKSPQFYLQICMFSATMTDDVDRFASEYLVNPINIDIGHVALQANLRQQFVRVVPSEMTIKPEPETVKEGKTKRIRSKRLREEAKIDSEGSNGKAGEDILPHISQVKTEYLVALCANYFKDTKTIIFCKYKSTVHRLFLLLNQLNLPTVEIQGNQSQEERFEALQAFVQPTNGPGSSVSTSANFLITTDVSARGLDISAIRIVVNFDLPATLTTYIHRVGRTARIGTSGTAVSLVYEPEDAEIMRKIVLISGSMNNSSASAIVEQGDEGEVTVAKAPQHMASVKRRDVPAELLKKAREDIGKVFDNVRDLLAAEELEEKIAKAEKKFMKHAHITGENREGTLADTFMAAPKRQWILSKSEKRKREEESRRLYEKESEITLNHFQNEVGELEREEQKILLQNKIAKRKIKMTKQRQKEAVKAKQKELRKKSEKKIQAGVLKKLKKRKMREATKERRAESRAKAGRKAYVHGDGKKKNKKSRHSKKVKRH